MKIGENSDGLECMVTFWIQHQRYSQVIEFKTSTFTEDEMVKHNGGKHL